MDLTQLFLVIIYSRKVGERLSLGVSPVLAVQAFRGKGLSAFTGYTEDVARSDGEKWPDGLTDKGRDFSFGYGARVGMLWSPVSYLDIGLAYQSRMFMTELDDYASLFAEDGDFDIPPSMTAGFALKSSSGLVLVFDFQKIWYGEIDSVANPVSNVFRCPTLGGDDRKAASGATMERGSAGRI